MVDSRILIGLIAILISISGIVYIAIGEADRHEEFKAAFRGRSIESGASIYSEFCSPCHGVQGQGIEGVAPALNTEYFFTQRLDDIGYQGSLEAYITLTVAGGRPVKSDETWPNNMPTWSVDYGGPLRNDQIGNVVDFILNWEEAAPPGGGPDDQPAAVVSVGDTPEERGQNLFASLGCVGCHIINGEGGGVGPELTNVYEEKGEDYIRESVLMPNAVIAEGYQPNIMPQTFGERLSDEQVDEIVAYLQSVNAGG